MRQAWGQKEQSKAKEKEQFLRVCNKKKFVLGFGVKLGHPGQVFNAVRRANRVAQTDKEIPKSTQRAWGAATISGQLLCMLGTEHDVPKIAGKMIKEQL